MGDMIVNPNHPDVTGGRLYPIPQISPDALRTIPIGSEVVIFNMDDATVEDGDWSEFERDRFLQIIDGATPKDLEHLFMFYLPPLVTPNAAILKALSEHGHTREHHLFNALVTGELTAPEFAAILRDVASEAQKEVALS